MIDLMTALMSGAVRAAVAAETARGARVASALLTPETGDVEIGFQAADDTRYFVVVKVESR